MNTILALYQKLDCELSHRTKSIKSKTEQLHMIIVICERRTGFHFRMALLFPEYRCIPTKYYYTNTRTHEIENRTDRNFGCIRHSYQRI